MTVKELIKNLQYYPRDLEVVVADYEVEGDSREINVCDINREMEGGKDVLIIG